MMACSTLQALHNLGGSGSVDEIEDEVAKILNLSEDEVNVLYKGTITSLSYRLGWTRNYLKGYGLLENSSRGVWALTEIGLKTKEVNKVEVKRFVRQKRKLETDLAGAEAVETNIEIEEEIRELTWQESLIELLKKIDPIAFERLCQRFLRELGFQNVEVTQRSNDGGIDGVGILKIGSVISFRCVFQAKRYKNTVSPDIIRDFRGAMIGRGDRGVIIMTGTFTREAKKEAIRDGAPPIDLIDGNELAEKLKELGLGVEVGMVEKVNIKTDWFKSI
ncbi:MAG: restriction endonuclease [Saprospiraceae bacterium]|nr:restriction endonuclease [Saprospiraceae bacterium]